MTLLGFIVKCKDGKITGMWENHEATKHSVESVRRGAHRLDWANQPVPYKRYVGARQTSLPRDVLPSDAGPRELDAGLTSTLLQLSAGITTWLRLADGSRMPFRAAACTGALYHIDLYLVCGDLAGIPAGVYHFDIENVALTHLRRGDYRAALVEATAGECRTPATLVATSTFWRNAWKYQARTYRHSFWDSGTILANLLAVASAQRLPARVLSCFVDASVNDLLDVDAEREAAVALVPLGDESSTIPAPRAFSRLNLDTRPVSFQEIDYPLIRQAQQASSMHSAPEVAAWRSGPAEGSWVPEGKRIEDVIRARGSARRFRRQPIAYDAFRRLLGAAQAALPADFATLARPYLIVNAVDGLPSGAYDADQRLLKAGDFRAWAEHLALDQSLAGDAAANIYFLTEPKLGERGYRACQLDASIRAGRVYLAAYAQGLAATGLTFYDDEVSGFFGTTEQVMFLVAVGIRA